MDDPALGPKFSVREAKASQPCLSYWENFTPPNSQRQPARTAPKARYPRKGAIMGAIQAAHAANISVCIIETTAEGVIRIMSNEYAPRLSPYEVWKSADSNS